MESKWVEVGVEHRATGIIGVHYVEVDGSFVYPEARAKSFEQERLGDSYKVLWARLWR